MFFFSSLSQRHDLRLFGSQPNWLQVMEASQETRSTRSVYSPLINLSKSNKFRIPSSLVLLWTRSTFLFPFTGNKEWTIHFKDTPQRVDRRIRSTLPHRFCFPGKKNKCAGWTHERTRPGTVYHNKWHVFKSKCEQTTTVTFNAITTVQLFHTLRINVGKSHIPNTVTFVTLFVLWSIIMFFFYLSSFLIFSLFLTRVTGLMLYCSPHWCILPFHENLSTAWLAEHDVDLFMSI